MVKNKRSSFAVILALVMIFALAACGTSNGNNSEPAGKSDAKFTGKAIVVYYFFLHGLYGGHGAVRFSRTLPWKNVEVV